MKVIDSVGEINVYANTDGIICISQDNGMDGNGDVIHVPVAIVGMLCRALRETAKEVDGN